ncbi:phosphoribosyl-ATP pyrophosphohydrolase [Pleomorphomonas carboxyditropha]|uniref:Phosphoribosyl-ATP pyrophosphohydrolase n=1 Tax=Pleomorphomonas carboxyditropha TaxID=2023338 RepID=A0A2G9X3B6_9HYPH|nr:phosphoribosyl-ATP pyrophosphohydrolase [Pleomorphomonas carboxyditropha]PIP00861.1 phosphoribosyl-ATP pyrophosphohydrolase [Pleomorphomonas carboxyditropha]
MSAPSLNALADRLEAISAAYAATYAIDRGGDWFLLKVQEEMGEMTQAWLSRTGRSRRDADDGAAQLPAEVADVFCQLLLFARAAGVDLDAAVREKWLRWEPIYGLRSETPA